MADATPINPSSIGPRETHWRLVISVLKNAVPQMATNVLSFVNETTNIIFIGHYASEAALAAVGLGNMMQNVFGLSIGIGLIGALDTLISQAHGAKDWSLVGVYFQRARVLSTLQLAWIVPVLMFSERILLAIGQDASVAKYAGHYNMASAPFLFAFFQQCAIQGLLRNLECPKPATVVALVTSVMHIAWCAIFVAYYQLDTLGVGLANGVTWTLQWLLLSGYLWWIRGSLGLKQRAVLWIQREAWTGWQAYMSVALPSLVQLCGEWWFWEITAILAGYLGPASLAAHVSALNFVAICFMMVLGISAAAATLVGKAIGANSPKLAKHTAVVCIVLNLILWICLCIVTLFGASFFAELYTKDGDVQSIMRKLLVIFAFVGFFDSSQNVMGSVFRGLGRMQLASIVYIVSYYFVMLPMALLLAFPVQLGIDGVWYAMGIGTFVATVCFMVLLARTSFEQMSLDASKRISQDGMQITTSLQPQAQEVRTLVALDC